MLLNDLQADGTKENPLRSRGHLRRSRKINSWNSIFLKFARVSNIKEYFGNLGISWSFFSPYGPHFGGIWEAAVKSFKHQYKRVLGVTFTSFEEHSTLATQIKACLNSRSLCAISPNGRNPIPLTPGHFLVGRPLQTLLPESNVSDVTRAYRHQYMLLLGMGKSFWSKWKREVSHQLI